VAGRPGSAVRMLTKTDIRPTAPLWSSDNCCGFGRNSVFSPQHETATYELAANLSDCTVIDGIPLSRVDGVDRTHEKPGLGRVSVATV